MVRQAGVSSDKARAVAYLASPVAEAVCLAQTLAAGFLATQEEACLVPTPAEAFLVKIVAVACLGSQVVACLAPTVVEACLVKIRAAGFLATPVAEGFSVVKIQAVDFLGKTLEEGCLEQIAAAGYVGRALVAGCLGPTLGALGRQVAVACLVKAPVVYLAQGLQAVASLAQALVNTFVVRALACVFISR